MQRQAPGPRLSVVGFPGIMAMLSAPVLAAQVPASQGVAQDALTVEDAIRMVRIEDRYGTDDRFAVFSPDGSKLATVVWRGDLDQDVNLYSLLVFDVAQALARPGITAEPVLTIPFPGDSIDQAARPIEQLAFLDDNRTVTFLGTLGGELRQVYAVNTANRDVRSLTWHPTAVTAYAVAGDGRVRLYAAAVPNTADSTHLRHLWNDGFSPYEEQLFGREYPMAAAIAVQARFTGRTLNNREEQGFFVPGAGGGAPTRITGAGELREQLPPEAVLQGLWAPDGGSVLLRVGRTEWGELSTGSRSPTPVPIPEGWTPIRWDATVGLLVRRADSVAVLRKDAGTWGTLRPLGVVAGFNRRRPVVTNGRVAVGVVDSLTVPPDLAAWDFSSRRLTVLSDLNPDLRNRRYGEVEQLRFPTSVDTVATGWVVKPLGYQPGRRYPLVVLQANERERSDDRSYLIDGRQNLTGHAAQMLAARGFMVLYIGEAQYSRAAARSPTAPPRRLPSEIEAVLENREEAIRTLARMGYVDSLRVGISGWSRSAWYTDQLLMHSSFRFAAATQIDGGTVQYSDRLRPYSDDELGRIRTPLLLHAQGPLQLASAAAMADRLRAMGKPADMLYFPTAPHTTKRPSHRWRSLTTHIDWWRFWLQNEEDPDPAKAGQYRRWRHLAGWQASGGPPEP